MQIQTNQIMHWGAGAVRPDHAGPDLSGIKVDTGGAMLSLDAPQMAPQMTELADTASRPTVEVGYTVHGADFTASELEDAETLLRGITEVLQGASGNGLHYVDYAQRGLGEQALRETAQKAGFDEKQVQAILTDYRDRMREQVTDALQTAGYDNNRVEHLPHAKYYLVRREESGMLVTAPEVAVDFERIDTIYQRFAWGSLSDAQSLFDALVRETESAVSSHKLSDRMTRYQGEITETAAQLAAFTRRFLTDPRHIDTYA